jgi:YjbE family integral membrane protein
MTPEIGTAAWWSAFASIVLIDLVLAGDNAIVIGLAARNVEPRLQKKVIAWGTAGAVIVRALLTFVVVWLLKVPGFLLAGGLALVYVGWRLTRDSGQSHAIEARSSFRAAVQTIVVADAVMGVDNVLAVGGAAHGSWLLVILGLVVSVPIVVWGSALVLRWVQRFPAILWLGAGVLGWTAAKMILGEPLLDDVLARAPLIAPALQFITVGGLVAAPVWRSLSQRGREAALALVVAVAWVFALGAVDRHVTDSLPKWAEASLLDEAIDLVRWLGWIPLVLLVRSLTPHPSPLPSGERVPEGRVRGSS